MLCRAAHVGSFGHSMMTTRQVTESKINSSVMLKDCAFVLKSRVNWKMESIDRPVYPLLGHKVLLSVIQWANKQGNNDTKVVRLNLFHLQMMMEQWCCLLWANELKATMGWSVYIPVAHKSICNGAFVETEIVICRELGFKGAGLNLVFTYGCYLSFFFP